MEFSGSESPLLLIRRAPSFAYACIVACGVDLALISLVPAMVARTSVAEPILALALVSAMALDTMLLQYPIAILADDYGLRKVSIIAATSVFLFFSLIPYFMDAIIITTLVALSRLVLFVDSIQLRFRCFTDVLKVVNRLSRMPV